jgi:hypothetical protein
MICVDRYYLLFLFPVCGIWYVTEVSGEEENTKFWVRPLRPSEVGRQSRITHSKSLEDLCHAVYIGYPGLFPWA